MSPRESRYAKNQALFRELNARVAELAVRWSDQPIGIFCECSTTGCAAMITVPVEEYNRVREHGSWFLIVPGHVAADAERVISQHEGYDIVESNTSGADEPAN